MIKSYNPSRIDVLDLGAWLYTVGKFPHAQDQLILLGLLREVKKVQGLLSEIPDDLNREFQQIKRRIILPKGYVRNKIEFKGFVGTDKITLKRPQFSSIAYTTKELRTICTSGIIQPDSDQCKYKFWFHYSNEFSVPTNYTRKTLSEIGHRMLNDSYKVDIWDQYVDILNKPQYRKAVRAVCRPYTEYWIESQLFLNSLR